MSLLAARGLLVPWLSTWCLYAPSPHYFPRELEGNRSMISKGQQRTKAYCIAMHEMKLALPYAPMLRPSATFILPFPSFEARGHSSLEQATICLESPPDNS